MVGRYTRRQVLATCVGMGNIAITGCLGGGSDDGTEGSGSDQGPSAGGSDGGSGFTGEPSFAGTWRMRRTDAQGSGYLPDVGGPAYPVEELWTHEVESNLAAQPVIAEGTIFVNDDGVVTALDAETGERQWQSEPDLYGSRGATLALADDVLVVGSAGVHGVDPETGDDRWAREEPGYRPIVSDDLVYVNDNDASILALDVSTGETRWQVSVPNHVSNHRVDEDGRLFTLDNRNVVRGFEAGGDELWSYDLDVSRLRNGIICGGGSVFVANEASGRVVALDAATGEVTWTTSTSCDKSPAYDGEYVYVADALDTITKLDAETGSVPSDWTTPDIGYHKSGPIVTDQGVYVILNESSDEITRHAIGLIDPETGQEQWRSAPLEGDGIPRTMALAEDVVYYPTEEAITAVAPR